MEKIPEKIIESMNAYITAILKYISADFREYITTHKEIVVIIQGPDDVKIEYITARTSVDI
ncbi:hypothetical protein H17ap60334_03175 [Thermosipho africanus H17ap60334]|jgi:hypothetical protein|nr:hypothetical protein H17ap60334_03175 [Thermosipho africanus H17ap60334]